MAVAPFPGRVQGPVERLAFNQRSGEVLSRRVIEATIARSPHPTFATASFREPRDWGYVGLVAFTAVLLLRPQDQLPFLRPLHLAEICALIGLAPMLFHRIARGAPVFRITPETVGLICFGLIMIATVPFSVWPGGALQEFTGSYLKALLVFILMVNTLTTPKRLEQLTWLILVSVGNVAARGVFDYARGVNLVEGGRLAGAVGGIFGNPNDLALNMVTFLPIAAIVAMSRWQPRWRRVVAAAIVALMMATTVFSKSRSGAVGLVVMFGALLLMGRTVRPRFAPIALAAVLVATPFMPTSFWQRMASIVDEQADKQQFTGSREARRIVMQEGIDAFLEIRSRASVRDSSRTTTRQDGRNAGRKRTTRSSKWRPRPAWWGCCCSHS